MSQTLDVTYYYHSGFSVATDDVMLIFDYWRGEDGELSAEHRIMASQLASYREVYVFVSHEHPDHLDRSQVEEWAKLPQVTVIVSDSMLVGVPGKRMKAYDERKLSDSVTVKAYESTDLGVSFLVRLKGMTIFHAGDLNFWHWRDESTAKEIDDADHAFREAVAPICQEEIDLAFFPVDPRQGVMFEAGANYFIISVKPRILIPMHFWDRVDITTEFARHSTNEMTTIIPMTRHGEMIRLEADDEGALTVIVPEAAPSVLQQDAPSLIEPDQNSPFLDTDLPVRFEE